MKNFIVRSYVTDNTPYLDVAKQYLIPSLKKFHSIDYAIDTVPNLGSWRQNTAYKPEFILNKLYNKHYKSTIFLDADATVEQYPSLFDVIPEEYDMACHFLDWETWYGHTQARKELLSGTLMFRNNREHVIRMVNTWKVEAQKGNEWEQVTLARVLERNDDIKVFELPLSYIYIRTLPNGDEPKVKIKNPIIVHHQVSRTLKRMIK